jgi:hypothetical protein
VVVSVIAYFLQIVVLTRHAQALLGIGDALKRGGFVAQKVVFKGRHAAVNKQQRGVVFHHQRSRGHDMMPFRGEKVEELLADGVGGWQ